ncbi:MAG: cell division protein ZipA C-terminal FtsZ-binding domain-containing protein [Stagnimonas sp.]|nr:cell division protein ZipA C-terminal FtsZ-binding domain-containing protein [Stagnimonas sp.]
MTPLQWALLIVGIGAAVAVWWASRRKGDGLRGWQAGGGGEPALGLPRRATDAQLDMFSSTGQFDEFGVGRPRKVAPRLGDAPTASQAARNPVQQKIVALLIAERDGTHINGPKIHAALKAQGLEFGDKHIYHRLAGGEPVFSVASLLKPGYLDPSVAAGFSTPGLSMFMVLPGPVPPVTAFREMMQAAQGLAQALNAEVYDMRRKPLTPESLLKLEHDVEHWARQHPTA